MSDDPTVPKGHEPSKADAEVWVPMIRQYGIVLPGGAQTIYQSVSHPSGGASIQVHADDVTRVLRAIEGSKLLKLPEPSPDVPVVRDAARLQSLELPSEAPSPPAKASASVKSSAKKRKSAAKK